MPNGNERSYTLTQFSSWKMQVCLSLDGVSAQQERINKINVHD